ncbi:T-cell surface glycoprotein CD3 gamma chain-like [Centroberyx affinis]|uniref:T-cell surface glycoprotein CD3 gamma chain-like n=1 Tax=Centroberyx affinis TaxID=166261 RepID=UPI003A5BC393
MRGQMLLLACLLLLWQLTAFVNCQTTAPPAGSKIKVDSMPDGVRLTCPNSFPNITKPDEEKVPSPLIIEFSDTFTGEYTCSNDTAEIKIYVKLRTCDNCIELDTAEIVGIAAGDLVATVLIGVAVYLVASQARTGPPTSNKKASDKQHLIPNDNNSRGPNDVYQPLRRGGPKDEYDVLSNRR